MTKKGSLINLINSLSEEQLLSLLSTARLLADQDVAAEKPDCPYCCSPAVIRYGHAIDYTAKRLACSHQTVFDHSFIKQRYTFYRGVASKYINRYNRPYLFASSYAFFAQYPVSI